ncbi:MAG: tyrosine--tRNA ligase [Candidatus Pacearchaeota archaeon]|jgi:tyrosyl-tRNA synthetase
MKRNLSVDEKLELIKRNIVEIVGEEELKKSLEAGKGFAVYHGFEPSGEGLHIGAMIGIGKHIDFQNAGLKLKLLCADLHAYLNRKGSLEKIRLIAQLYKEGFEALGVDMKKADYVLGSDFQLKGEYFLDVMKLSLKVSSQRANRAMSVIAREDDNPPVAQMIYPLMQTLDLKYLNSDAAFGDMPQRKIHMLMRENLPELDYKSPVAIHHADMIGLTGGKMSSSIPNSRILIDEEPNSIKKKIKGAFCPEKQINDNPILQICKFIIFPRCEKIILKRSEKFGGNLEFNSYAELEKSFGDGKLHPLDLKNTVAENLIKVLEPVRRHMTQERILKLREKINEID